MVALINISVRELVDIMKDGKEIWAIGCYDRVFKSKINKIYGFPFDDLKLRVWDEELSKDVTEYRNNNAEQSVSITNAFTAEVEARDFLLKINVNN